MISKLDHIDIKVEKLEETVNVLSLLGLKVLRRAQAPRNSVEMVLQGDNQVIIELHPAKPGDSKGVHHIAFHTDGEDVARLKEHGIVFKAENRYIKETGRTVSSFNDINGLTWQLTD